MDAVRIEAGEERITAGRQILKLADEIGLGAQAAFWLYVPETLRWRYHLVTPMVDHRGPRWVYDRLLKVFAKVKLPPGIKPLDVYVTSPTWEIFGGLVFTRSEGEGDAEMAVNDIRINSTVVLKAAYIYRMRPKATAQPNKFDLKVRQLLAA